MADQSSNALYSATPESDIKKTVSGTTPAPGGPNPVVSANMGQPREALRQSIAKDIGAGQEALGKTMKGLGARAPQLPSTFRAKGFKIGERAVGADELKKLTEIQGRAIERFVTQAGFTDQISMDTAKGALNDKLDAMKLDLIKRGVEFDKRLAQKKASDMQRRAAAKAWGTMAGTLAGAAIGGATGGFAGAAVGAGFGAQTGGAIGGGL